MISKKRALQIEKMNSFIKNNEIGKLKKMLKSGVSPNNCSYYIQDEKSPLIEAVEANNAEAVKLLLEYGARTTSNATNDPFIVAFTHAIWDEKKEITALFLEAGADPNSYTDGGGFPRTYRAIDSAVCRGNAEIVKMLLKKGADPNKGISEGSPLRNALKSAHKNEEAAREIVYLLLAHGAKLRYVFK